MTKPLFMCLACACCHTHTITACDAHECKGEKKTAYTAEHNRAVVQKALDAKMEEYVQELLKIQKEPGLQETAETYSRHLAWLQERLDELTNTKPTDTIFFYQNRLVGKMNAKLMAQFEDKRDTKIQALPA